ncbi:MAG: hypothetical protein WD402_02380 [Chloroflexota bacterium]
MAAIAPIAIVAAVGVGAASAMPLVASTIGAGTAAVSACDTDGLTFHHTVDTSGRLTVVTVGSMAAACAGGTLRLTVTNGATSAGEGTVALPSAGFTGSAAVTLGPQPLSTAVTAVYIVVEG